MSGDAFLECHYTIIAVLFFVEHVIVLLAAITAFVSAYKASRLKPAIKKNGRKGRKPELTLPEISL